MTFREGCPDGRSQDLMCVSEEMVTIDRKTLEEIFSLIGDCVDTLQICGTLTFLLLRLNAVC